MEQQLRLIATCPEETKPLLIAELQSVGATAIVADFRSVYFSATVPIYYAVHLRLRTASGLFRVIKMVRAPTETTLRNHSSRVAWPRVFDLSRSFRVDGIDADRSGQGMIGSVISKKIKEGIFHSFQRSKGAIPTVSLKKPQVLVVGYNQQYKCTISIDTAGQSLHKRGYRSGGRHPAPLKETLAATVLQQIGYCGRKPLLDAMCGSGTLAIEAAMIARQQAPLLCRPAGVFGFEHLHDFDHKLWEETRQRAQQEARTCTAFPIIAADIDASYVQLARDNASNAGVAEHIEFSVCPFAELKPDCMPGTVIANLPYGDRLGGGGDLVELYRRTGDCLKQNFTGWEAVLLTASYSPWRSIGLHPRKKFKFYNGRIEILVLVFDLYAGSRRRIIREEATPTMS